MAVLYNGGLGGGYLAGNPINGTEKIGTNFGLGGTLTKDTTINASGKDFDFFQTVGGFDQTLHIGKTLNGNIPFVGEHIEDVINKREAFNGVADLSAFGLGGINVFAGYADFSIYKKFFFIANNTGAGIQYAGTVKNFETRVNSGSAFLLGEDLSNNSRMQVLVDDTRAKMLAEDNINAKGANVDVVKDGSILSSFTSHFIAEGVGTTDKNFGYSAFTDRFTGGAAADSATMYRYDQVLGLDERVFGINNDNLWASFLYDVTDNQNYRLLGFTAGDSFSRLYYGAEVVAGSTDLANSTYFEAGPNGLKLKGAIMSDQVETVSATPMPATYKKRIAIKDLNNNLLGYMPIL